ncbi:response regulator [Marinomonas algarum]|uniref:histidine kinase n=1 Tax=Marinomonas algarum TaxID=2883105 RepID=A0A9X1IM10_9GAMM|nr:response regulator [Marinomonas algarum]MCB5161700.1 response regulator [Marinomonas algarum]
MSPLKTNRVFYLILPFVLFVSVIVALLDYERRASASNAGVVSDVNQIHSTAQAIINRFYWESVDSTIAITFQGTQQNLFTGSIDSVKKHQAIDQLFIDAFHRNDAVSQIRWIDKDGIERHRMNRTEGKLHDELITVEGERLQDKSGRYYVVEAQKLKSGYLYLSKLDLNIENGQVVRPYEPTIRLATPIRDSNNTLQGIIVINFNIKMAFHKLNDLAPEGIDIDLFNAGGQLRYSNSMPDAAFLDLLKGDVLSRGEEAVNHYYEKSKTFKHYITSPPEGRYHKSSDMHYAPQIKAQEKLTLLVLATESHLNQRFKKNLLGAFFLGSLTLFLGCFLAFLLYRSDKKVIALNRALNEQLQISEHSREVKSQFLANMSHEIRTPMTAISGLLTLLLKEKLDDSVRQRLTIIKESSEGLRRIINDILDLSKIESGKSVLSLSEFRPALTVERCISTFNGSAHLKGIELLLDMEPSLFFYTCHGDEYRIEQVINNLLSNAIKFSKDSPVLVSVTSHVHQETQLELTCTVIDQGIGMSDDLVMQLGESFTQADNRLSNDNNGTGLGLSISKALLDSMEATLTIKSTLGVGSQFSFTVNLDVLKKEAGLVENNIAMDDLNVWLVNTDHQSSHFMNKIFHHWGGHAKLIKSADELQRLVDDEIHHHMGLDFILFDLEHSVSNDDVLYTLNRFIENHVNLPKMVVMTSDESRWRSYLSLDKNIELFKKPVTISGFLELLQKVKLVPNIQALEGGQEASIKQLESDIRDRVIKEGQPNILLVEDNITNQHVIAEIFNSMGISVKVANNGKEAVEYVLNEPVDMIFMDVQMPVMSGLEATEIIRQHYTSEQLPIIALSAGVTDNEFEQSERVGMNTHVPKPIDLDKLMSVVVEYWPQTVCSLTPDQLQAFDEFDLSNTAYKWLGDTAYLKVLASFLKEFGGIIQLTSHDEKAAFVHKLKGASGNVGATALHDVCARYEKELIKGDVSIDVVLDSKRQLNHTF